MSSTGESMVSRIVKVLGAFQANDDALTPAEIARSTGIPAPTTYRLVGELVRWGLLERTSDRKLRTGLRLWELALRNSPQLRLRDRALPYLEALHGAMDQHTQLSVLSGTDIVYIETLASKGGAVSIVKVASRLPAAVCAPGLVFAAYSTPNEVSSILAAVPRSFTPKTPTRAEDLIPVIEEVRASGVAVTQGWIHSDATGVAVPVMGRKGELAAALSVIVPTGSPLVQTCIPALRAAAHGIGRSLQQVASMARDPQLNLLEFLVRQETTESGAVETFPPSGPADR